MQSSLKKLIEEIASSGLPKVYYFVLSDSKGNIYFMGAYEKYSAFLNTLKLN